MTEIAIIGGGAGGLGAAYALTKAGLSATLIEAEPRVGGHCFAVPVPLSDGGTFRVDAGVSDFNEATFATVRSVLEDLGVNWYAISQDASFMTPGRDTAWYSRDGEPHFVQDPKDRTRLLNEIRQFNETCVEVLEDASYAEWTARKYLDARGYSDEFRTLYFDPRAQGSFPMPDRPPEQFMIRSMVAFWNMHGIVGPGPPHRMVVEGGMHTYPQALGEWLRDHGTTLRLATRVIGVARSRDGIRVRAVDGARNNLAWEFDHVLIATNANHVIGLLEDPTQEERRIFAGFGWQRARLVVHQDEHLMPNEPEAWGAFNYLIAHDGDPEIRPTITFYPNRLARLDTELPDVFVTMNPYREPDPERVVTSQFFVHPAVGGISDMACERLEAIQGRRNTWYCGSYLREPFVHEQALRCGVDLGERLADAVRKGAPPKQPQSPAAVEFDEFLREIPLFAGLDTMALVDLQLAAEPFYVNARQPIFQQGDEPDGMYLLKTGTVRITRRLPGDDAVDLARVESGAVIGELGLLDRGRRAATAVADEPCSGYFLSARQFDLLRANHSRAAIAVFNRFLGEVAARARASLDELSDILTATPELATGTRSEEKTSPSAAAAALPDPDALVCLPFFRSIGHEGLEQLANTLRLRSYPRGAVVFRQEEPVNHCVIVLRGALALTIEAGGYYLQLAVLGPGSVAGGLGMIDDLREPLTCRACEDTLAFVVERERFEELRQAGGPVAFKFMETVAEGLATRLRKVNGHLARLRPERHYDATRNVHMFEPGKA